MTLLVCLLFAFGLYFAFEFGEENLFEQHLDDDISTFIHQYSVIPGIADIPRDNFQVLIANDGDTSTLPEYLRDLPPDVGDIQIGDRILEVEIRKQGDSLIYFLIEETPMEQFEQTLVTSVIIIIIAICVVSMLLGYLLANQVIKPVTRLSDEVNRLEIHAGRPVDVHNQGGDEISILSHAIDAFKDRVNILLAREREFSSDVSHELRTPLMGIQAAAENLLRNNEDVSRVLVLSRRIEARCRQMRLLIDSLLVLARDPTSLENDFQEINMRDIVNDQIDAASHLIADRNTTTRIIEHKMLVILSSESILSVIFGNLLRNALFHSESAEIWIELSSDKLLIRDFGQGMSSEARDKLCRHGGSGRGKGNGIGLPLVRRLCDHFGWILSVVSEPGEGTTFIVSF